MSQLEIFCLGLIFGLGLAGSFSYAVMLLERKRTVIKYKIEVDADEAVKRLKEMEQEVAKFKKEMNI